jgi:hypothetical protein
MGSKSAFLLAVQRYPVNVEKGVANDMVSVLKLLNSEEYRFLQLKFTADAMMSHVYPEFNYRI